MRSEFHGRPRTNQYILYEAISNAFSPRKSDEVSSQPLKLFALKISCMSKQKFELITKKFRQADELA